MLAEQSSDWEPYIARCPTPNPQSAQCSSVLQSAPMRNPPCRQHNIASSVRTWNCAGPGTTQHWLP
eukprot:13553346-Alexandrium_andersonii.AAC.1